MKIGIIGAGAMGSVYAGLMADSGHDVWMFDNWAEHVAAINANGLKVEGASGDRVAKPHATSNAADAGVVELAIVATKAMQTKAAVEAAAPMLGPNTAVLTLQNGLGNVERIQELVDPKNVLCGIAGGFGASMVGPGHVHHNGMEAINIAEAASGLTDRVENVATAWRDSGFKVGVYEDIWPVVWSKLMANIAVSATCSLTGMRVGRSFRTNGPGVSAWIACAKRRPVPKLKASSYFMMTPLPGCMTSPPRSQTPGHQCTWTRKRAAFPKSVPSMAALWMRASSLAFQRRHVPSWCAR